MKNQNRKLISKIDFWIIASLLVLSAGIYVWYTAIFQNQVGFTYGQIIIDGSIVETIDLSKSRIFSLEELPDVSFEVNGGSVAFVKSNCPDQICVNNGFLDMAGQISVCLPNLVSLIIRTTDGSENFDVMVH